MNKWIIFGALFVVIWLFATPYIGIGTGWVPALLFTFLVALTVDFLNLAKIFPLPSKILKPQWRAIILIVGWVWLAWTVGWLAQFSTLLPTGALTPTNPLGTAGGAAAGLCSVGSNVQGEASTLSINAWDQEANAPYGSAVDLGTNCYIFRDGNLYVNNTQATNGATITGKFSAGDTVSIDCGGSSYYADPISSQCVDSQSKTIDIKAHKITALTDLQTTAYTSDGTTALDAQPVGGTTVGSWGDYNESLGSNQIDQIYLKLKVNGANEAYQFCAWGITRYQNISSVYPGSLTGNGYSGSLGTYTQIGTPQFLSGVAVYVNNSKAAYTLSKDYAVYELATPIMLHQWDSIKEAFTVKTTSNPIDAAGSANGVANLNGYAIQSLDCQYSRGTDGTMHLGVGTFDTSGSNVGLAENVTTPMGKYNGVQIVAQ